MYSKVFKNNQVTYGNPFKVNVPISFRNIAEPIDEEDSEENFLNTSLDPEEIIEKAKKEYNSVVEKAQIEAQEIVAQAKEEASQQTVSILEDAWQKGYSDGMDAAKEQNESILAESMQIRKSSSEEHDAILSGLEKEIVELTIKVVRKVVSCELQTNREVILKLVEEALSSCSNKESVVLKVSPEDGKYINENKDEFLCAIAGADEVDIKIDNSLKIGDCIVDTSFGSIDAGTNTKIDRIEETFKDQVAGR